MCVSAGLVVLCGFLRLDCVYGVALRRVVLFGLRDLRVEWCLLVHEYVSRVCVFPVASFIKRRTDVCILERRSAVTYFKRGALCLYIAEDQCLHI